MGTKHVCTCTHTYACAHVRMVCTPTFICTCRYMQVHVHMYIHAHVSVYMYSCVQACVYTCPYICVSHIHACICVHWIHLCTMLVHMHVRLCVWHRVCGRMAVSMAKAGLNFWKDQRGPCTAWHLPESCRGLWRTESDQNQTHRPEPTSENT